MRLAVLFMLFIIAQNLFAQKQTPVDTLDALKDFRGFRVTDGYTAETVNEKLNRSHKLIISGIVLTSTFGAVEIAGFTTAIVSEFHRNLNAAIAGILIAWPGGFFFLVPGVTTLGVGIHMKNRWTKRQATLPLHGGLLPDGNMGMALNF